MKTLTSAEARALLKTYPAREVAWTSKKGVMLDDDGETIDPRQAVPYTYALGPFGSWPATVQEAEAELAQHETWTLTRSIRLGWVVLYKSGWGFQANAPEETP